MAGGPDDRARLHRLITGHIPAQCVYVAAELRLVDAVPPGESASVTTLAAGAGVNEDALYRVLRVLAAEGIYEEVAPREFRPTPLGELLREGEISSRYFSLLNGGETLPMFGDIVEVVRTGKTVPVLRHGKTRFELLADDPERSEIFNRAMRSRAGPYVEALRLLDWSGIETVVDVGGGIGGLLLPLLHAEPHLRGVICDLPHVEADATRAIADAGVAERCTFEPGNFFERVPSGDAQLLSNILHDWYDAEAAQILKTCRAAATPGDRLVVVESLIAPGSVPDPTKLMDLQMLVVVGGRERTEAEFRELLDAAGFAVERVAGNGPYALDARAV